MDLLLLVFTLVLMILCALFDRGFGRYLYLINKIPGPPLWEFYLIHGKDLLSTSMLDHMCRLCESYRYKPWGFWMYSDFVVVVSDPKSIDEFSKGKNAANKPRIFYSNLKTFFGNGLLTSNGDEYKRHRKLIEPMLRKGPLESCYLPFVNDISKRLVEQLRRKDVDIRTTIEQHMLRLSYLVVTSGVHDYHDYKILCNTLDKVFSKNYVKSTNPVYYWCWYRWKDSSRRLESALTKINAELKETLLRVKDVVRNKKEPLLLNPLGQMLRCDEEEYSIEDLLSQFKTILVGNFETTAFVLNMCLLMLALHQDVQDKVVQEVESIFGESDRPVEPEDLSEMSYLERVIKETLRLYPSGPIVGRTAQRETTVDGVVVPEGCTIVINIMALHRNPNVYSDPLKFDPDRFLNDDTREHSSLEFIPFSFGSRRCPGQNQAFITLKTSVYYVVRAFRVLPRGSFKSLDDIKVKSLITLHLCNSIPLRLVSRSKSHKVSN